MPAQLEFGELYVQGARVWIKDKELVWRGCKLAAPLTAGVDKIALFPDDESPHSGNPYIYYRRYQKRFF